MLCRSTCTLRHSCRRRAGLGHGARLGSRRGARNLRALRAREHTCTNHQDRPASEDGATIKNVHESSFS